MATRLARLCCWFMGHDWTWNNYSLECERCGYDMDDAVRELKRGE